MKKHSPQPRCIFRLYCDPRADRMYFKVAIFRNRHEMYAWRADAANGHDLDFIEENYEGCVTPQDKLIVHPDGSETTIDAFNDRGWILLHDRKMGTGIVAHEMTHAALKYIEVTGCKPETLFDWNHADHERLCLVVGHMVRRFWNQYYSRSDKS